ncbi:MAG: SusC/RagA family TonB-linked outer membrane protein [Flavobacteriaceae bacterium]
MKNFIRFCCVIVFSIFTVTTYAQKIEGFGKVLDKETNSPLPGATIVIKDSSNGVTSDFDGNFKIKSSLGDVLVVSYIGYNSIEVVVVESEMIILMEPDLAELEEVTISVGYFDVSKKDLSGSISQINTEQLEKNRGSSLENLLQGQVAGVVINESSEPGGGVGISIRGTNSILGGTQPLYVLDGIPISPISDAEGNTTSGNAQTSMNFINPNDIEKIEILKDAAATAVYGARGANGVVLITSKSANKNKGEDKISVTIDSYLTSVREKINVMDGPGFESYMNQRVLNQIYQQITNPDRDGGAFDGSQALTVENYPEIDDYSIPYVESTGINTDWQDETYRLASTNSVNLSYMGGDFKKNLSINLGLFDQEGVIVNSTNKRWFLNTSAKTKAFGDKIDIYSRTNLSYKEGNASSVGNGQIFMQKSVVSQVLQFQPIYSLLDTGESDDVYSSLNEGDLISNPYTLAKYVIDQKKSFRIRQALSIIGKLTPKLTATFRGAYDYQNNTRDNYYPSSTTRGYINNGEASQSSLVNRKIYAEGNLRYRNRINLHRIDATLVATYEQNTIRSMFNKAIGFANDNTSFYNFNVADEIFVPISQYRENGLLSALTRFGYNYNRKYYIDLNARVDASSKFAENKKSAVFPSVAISWVISKERFLRSLRRVNDLKLRFSYGKTGSNPISPYQSLALMSPIRYNFDDELVIGFYEQNLENDDLTWETTDQFNAGFDLSMFNSRLNVTFDAYHKLTYDLLQNVNLPPSNGYSSRVDNFGEIENKGFEIGLQINILKKTDFKWDLYSNYSLNRNKLVSLNSNLDYQLGPSIGFSQAQPIMFMVGQPLGIFWGAETNGIFENWEQASASGIPNAAPGEINYVNHSVEYDEFGNPSDNQVIDFDDYVKLGDPNPDFTFSIGSEFSYKNWDMSLLFTGQEGGDIFWVDSWQLSGLFRTRNHLSDSFDSSWKAPLSYSNGSIIYDPSVGNTIGVTNPAAIIENGNRNTPSDRQVFDGSFLRLKNINLGYNFNFKNGNSLRLYLSGQNLLTWTKYPGYDPEVRTYTRNPQKRGVDFGSYPGTKSYIFGLKFNY